MGGKGKELQGLVLTQEVEEYLKDLR
jgi:hypothetical protein